MAAGALVAAPVVAQAATPSRAPAKSEDAEKLGGGILLPLLAAAAVAALIAFVIIDDDDAPASP